MRIRLSRSDIQHILLWAQQSKDKAEEVGLPFEADELAIIDKLKTIRDKFMMERIKKE